MAVLASHTPSNFQPTPRVPKVVPEAIRAAQVERSRLQRSFRALGLGSAEQTLEVQVAVVRMAWEVAAVPVPPVAEIPF